MFSAADDVVQSVDTHPWLIWALVVTSIISLAYAAFPKVREMLSPIFGFFSNRKLRGIQSKIRVEAEEMILNDQRVAGLSTQISCLTDQVERLLTQNRDADKRHALEITAQNLEIAALRHQLTEQTLEIAALRAELAAYRGEHEG